MPRPNPKVPLPADFALRVLPPTRQGSVFSPEEPSGIQTVVATKGPMTMKVIYTCSTGK